MGSLIRSASPRPVEPDKDMAIPLREHPTPENEAQKSTPTTAPAHLPSQTPTMPPSNIFAGVDRFTRDINRWLQTDSLKPNWQPVLTASQVQTLGIVVRPLDLFCKTPGIHSEPIPVQTINNWLSISQPWIDRGMGPGEYYDTEPYWDAFHTLNNLYRYAIHGGEEKSLMYPHTGWKHQLMWKRLTWYTKHDRFTMDNIMEHQTSKSHVHASISQRHVLQDGEITKDEIMSMVYLASTCVYKNGADAVPKITLMSGGGCRIRVVHGWIELPKKSGFLSSKPNGRPKLLLWVSPVADFTKPNGYASKEWKALLGWLLATPI